VGYFRIDAVLNCTVEKHIFHFDSHLKNEMLVENSCIMGVTPCRLVDKY